VCLWTNLTSEFLALNKSLCRSTTASKAMSIIARRVDRDSPRSPSIAYFPVIFLRNGGLAVVTTIQDRPAKRLGFSYWAIAD
jgi:hypothetical protein